MGITESVPGMKAERTARNLLLGWIYFLGLLFILPFVLLAIPIAVAVAVGTNWRNLADRLAASPLGRLPGVDPGGGLLAGGAVLGYAVLSLMLIGGVSALGGAPGDGGGSLTEDVGTATDDAGSVASETVTTTIDIEEGDQQRSSERHGSSAGRATPTAHPQTTAPTAERDTAVTKMAPSSKGSDESTPGGEVTETANSDTDPAGSTSGSNSDSEEVIVTVTDVVDGDTVDIRYENGSKDTVRLVGVDTPETYGETNPDEFEGVPDIEAGRECLRKEAEDSSEYTTQRLDGEQIRLTFDENEGRRGSYGRLLAYVWLDGTEFNHQLVEGGYARVYDSSFTKRDQYYASEDGAQHQDTGVWRCQTVEQQTETPTETGSDSRSSSSTVQVARVHADAAGDDHENENGEYVVFENTGGSALEMGGWTVSDEADHTYTVPSGFTLGAGEQVTLYTGSGDDSETELYWGSDAAIWNNGGDTIYVHDESGTLAEEHSYS